MPPPGHKKVPFSAKKKKEQLKNKRERKRNAGQDEERSTDSRGKQEVVAQFNAKTGAEEVDEEENEEEETNAESRGSSRKDGVRVCKFNEQPTNSSAKSYDPNRYRLHFVGETREDVERGKKLAYEPLLMLPETASELDLDDIYEPGSSLDMPKRPPWDYTMGREALDAREEKYFRKYVERIFACYSSSKISYFELNLETWRQLWRVIEMSDIILLITDIRHPALHFSPALYDHVVKDLKKQMILVLNKIDLAPPALVVAWKHFFQTRFPELCIICFTSFPKEAAEREKLNEDPALTLQKRRRRRAARAVGPKQLLVACEEIVHGAVDLKSWKEKIEYDFCGPEEDDDEGPEVLQEHVEEEDTSYHQHQSYGNGVLTIGCCGYPNVGKSSLINGLVGKKVVSVSRTPGHTKHFQTIFLTPSVKLCDCPGLVFPSLVSKPLQVLAGIFPIAQLREPYTSIRFLAERMNLPQLLKLRHPEVELKEKPPDPAILKWSAFDICDAWAEKRGFMTAKAARNDVYRAANHLLRMASEGRLCLCMKPRGFGASKDKWIQHPDAAAIEKQQEMHRQAVEFSEEEEEEEEDDDDEPVRGRDDEDSDEEDESKNIVASASANPFALLADDDDDDD